MWGDDGGKARKADGNFIVTWFDNYHILFNKVEILHLKTKKEQVFELTQGCELVKM